MLTTSDLDNSQQPVYHFQCQCQGLHSLRISSWHWPAAAGPILTELALHAATTANQNARLLNILIEERKERKSYSSRTIICMPSCIMLNLVRSGRGGFGVGVEERKRRRRGEGTAGQSLARLSLALVSIELSQHCSVRGTDC